MGTLKKEGLEAGDRRGGQSSSQGQEEGVASRLEEERAKLEGFLRKKEKPC